MKTQKIEISAKDIAVLNKIKKFLNNPESELSDREIHEFNKTVRWITRWFFATERKECNPIGHDADWNRRAKDRCPKQKMGHGSMKGLSGLTWDFSKMTAEDAEYMRRCLTADIEHDKIMHPEKYWGKTMYDKSNEYCNRLGGDEREEESKNDKADKFSRIAKLLLNLLKNKARENGKEDCKKEVDWTKIGELLLEILDKKED